MLAEPTRKRSFIGVAGNCSAGFRSTLGMSRFDGKAFKFRGVVYCTMHLRDELKPGAKIGAGSINQDARGRWYSTSRLKLSAPASAPLSYVGIDLGLHDLAALSTGDKVEAPRLYPASEERLATAQRARKTPKRVRNIHAKIANRRRDFLHRASAKIAAEFGLIVICDVSPKKIAQTRLAKSSLDAGWSDFKRMLSDKAIRHGGSALEVSERLSSQVCSECGSLPPAGPKGIADIGIREWTCSDCGTVHNRDVNAARNILRVGQHTLVEGALT